MASAPYFVPSADLLPYWPHDLIATSDVGMLGRVGQYLGVTDFDLIEYEGELTIVGTLALVAGAGGRPAVRRRRVASDRAAWARNDDAAVRAQLRTASGDVEGGAAAKALDLFLKGRPGPYELLLPAVDIGLRFDPNKLQPMRPKDASDLSKGFEPDPTVEAVQLNFRAAVAINTDTGVRLEAPGDLDLPYCQIGSTGIVISARDLVLRLSDVQPFPEGIDPEAFDLEPTGKAFISGACRCST